MNRVTQLLLVLAVAAAMAVVAAPAVQAEPSAEPVRGWLASGAVRALAQDGDRLFLGGDFQHLGRRAVGAAIVDRGDGVADLRLPEPGPAGAHGEGVVDAAVPDGHGGWYLGGTFLSYGGIARPRLVHVRADRTVDVAFDAQIATGAVSALALAPDGTLYVGGSFSAVRGVRGAHARLVALDAATGEVAWRDDASTPLVNGPVNELALSERGTLYLGGDFTSVAAAPRSKLAELRLADTTPTAWAPAVENGQVADIEPAEDRVFVGGTFTRIDGSEATGVAALRATDGAPVDGWQAVLSGGSVSDVEPAGDGLLVAGDFTRAGPGVGTARPGVAEVAAANGELRAWNPPLRKPGWTPAVGAIEEREGIVYVAGRFDTVDQVARSGAAAFLRGQATPTAWDPSTGVGSGLTAESADATLGVTADSVLLAAPGLTAVDVRPRGRIAAIDLAADRLLPLGSATAFESLSEVRALALSADGATLYAGGSFTKVSGFPRAGLAAFATDGDGAAPLAWDPGAVGLPDTSGRVAPVVNALAVRGADVIVGGMFERLGAVAEGATPERQGLGAVGGETAVATPLRADVALDSGDRAAVHALALSGDTLYVGGAFDEVGGIGRPALAAVDAESGAVRAWNPGPRTAPWTRKVLAIVPRGERVYVGGQFSVIGAQADQPARTNLAELDAASGDATAFDPAPDAEVRALAVDDDGTVYVAAAEMTTLAGQPRRHLGAVRSDGTASPWNPNRSDGTFAPLALLSRADEVIAGAESNQTMADRARQSIARFLRTGPVPLSLLVPPQITGTPTVGKTVTCRRAEWSGTPTARAYTWLRDGTPIADADTERLVITPADVDHDLRCRETATNDAGSVPADSAAVRIAGEAPRNFEPPAVVGDPYPGETVSCTTGIWANYPEVDGYAYRWLRDGEPVAGADGADLPLTESDLGHVLACEVAAFNAVGPAPSVRSLPVRVTVRPDPPAPPAPRPPGAPPAPPQPPASPVQPTLPVLPGDARDVRPSAATVTGSATLRADSRGRVRLRLACPPRGATCTGRVTLTARLRSRGRTRTVTVGRATLRIAAGSRRTVRVTLSRAARSALRRTRRLSVVATTGAGGGTATRKLTVRLEKKERRP